MTVLAAEQETGIAASPLELTRGGVSYAIDTLREARRANPESRIFFVLGTDQFAEIGSWREPGAIVGDFDLIVVERPGTSFKDAGHGLPDFVDRAVKSGRIHHAPIPPLDVSSTLIRERVRTGRPIAGLVSPSVDRYIRTHGLYREPETEPPSTGHSHQD
jgi:nicotinate-nucleotide adenylyltransferase